MNGQIIEFFDKIVAECGKEKHEYQHFDTPEDLWNDMVSFITPEAMEEAVFTDVKQVREENIRKIKDQLEERYAEEHEDWIPLIDEAVYKFQKKTVRKMILKDQKRPDWTPDQTDSSASCGSRCTAYRTWIRFVLPWTDTGIEHYYLSSSF